LAPKASTKKNAATTWIANFRDYEHQDMDIRDAAAVMDLFKEHRGTIEGYRAHRIATVTRLGCPRSAD